MRYQALTTMKFKTPSGIREIFPGQVIAMPEEKAARLVESGKVIPIRQDVTEVHTLDQYSEVFSLALAEVAPRDTQGEAIRQIRQDSPETWAEIQAAEDKVNELWKQSQGGRSVWVEYCAAVGNWKSLFLQAIEDKKRLSRLVQDGRSGRGKS